MGLQLMLAIAIGGLVDGQIALSDVGTWAVIGGVLGETTVRLAPLLGFELEADGWREGMFFCALIALALWVFGELGA